MKRAILVHGWNVRDNGAGTTDRLRPGLEALGFEVVEYDTGWRGLFRLRAGHEKRYRKLAGIIKPNDLLIGHSDGCSIINDACWLLSGLSVLCVYLHPALDRNTPLSPRVEKCLVFYSKSDRAVQGSKILLNHRFGDMGRVGYKEKNPVTRSLRYEGCEDESIGIMKPGHSGEFKSKGNIKKVIGRIKAFTGL